MDRAVLDEVIFYLKHMLSYKNYINDDVELLNKIYSTLGKEKPNSYNRINSSTYKYFINDVIKITLELLNNLGKEDKKYFSEQLPQFIKISLLDDDEKFKILDRLNETARKVIIQSFKYTDDEKIDLINKIEKESTKAEFIATLQDDDKKIELLRIIDDEKNKVTIIESIQDDNKKIRLLGNMTNQNYRAKIIKSLQNDNEKIELLKTITGEANKTHIIVSVQDDEEKIKQLENIESDENRARIIKSIQEDDKKIELIETVSDETYKTSIIKSIQDDDKKIALIEKIERRMNKNSIIESIHDDDKKIKMLDDNIDDFSRCRIIESLQDDDKKISMLDTVGNSADRCSIIKGMKVDEKKIEALDYLDSINLKLYVIGSLNDNVKKDLEINKIDSRLDRVYQTIAEVEKGKKNTNNKYKTINIPKDMTFGIEIECAGEYKTLVPKTIRKWKCEGDNSIGQDGVEVVSPIMHDTEEYVNEIYGVNEILRRIGMESTQTCGGHVHIGADYIKTEEGFRQLIELWGNAEEVYYLISNKPGEVPRDYTIKYARPISKSFEGTNSLGQVDVFIEDAKRIQKQREVSLNLLNVNNGKNTIEFRVSNGTVDGDTWIENIRLYGRTVQLAEELGEIVEKIKLGKEITEDEKRKYELKEMLKGEKTLDEKMEIIMQILFNEEERDTYQRRYNENKKLYEEEDEKKMFQFGKVDFRRKDEPEPR